jgi:hypothetical protein
VSERQEAHPELRDLGVLDALRWAQRSAYQRAYDDHEEAAGHTQGTFGYVATTLLEDRLDRVFSTGKYTIDDRRAGEDVRIVGLLPGDAATLPALPARLVRRADLLGSPGWRAGRWRFLLVKTEFGNVNGYRWAPTGPVRRSVARQPEPDQLAFALDSVPEGWIMDGHDHDHDRDQAEVAGLTDAVPRGPSVVLMVAHSGDRRTGELELFLGRSRWNGAGGPPWHWLIDLIADAAHVGDGAHAGPGRPVAIPAVAPPPEPLLIDDVLIDHAPIGDAPVRLRPIARPGAAGGPA